MLPSEKAERWVRRIGYVALALIALYIIIWIAHFIVDNYGKAMKQREFPEEGKVPVAELASRLSHFEGPAPASERSRELRTITSSRAAS